MTAPLNLLAAHLCQRSYAQAATWARNDVHVCRFDLTTVTAVVWRGSASFEDWWRDFQFLPHTSSEDPELGRCHSGFLGDMLQVADQIDADVGDRPVVVFGHSKGAAEGSLYAARRAARGKSISSLITFGLPRFCLGGQCRGLLTPVGGSDFWNYQDPVPMVPFSLEHGRPISCPWGSAIVPEIGAHFIESYIKRLS